MAKTTIDELFDDIENECGKYCWCERTNDKEINIQCLSGMEEDVKKIIEGHGYKINSMNWFSGSSYDGYNFEVEI